jgi:hypothetical protein
VKRDNDNKAITTLPVLLLTRSDSGDGWVTAPDPNPVLVHGEKLRVLKRHPVRIVPEDALQQFASPKTRPKFEAEFGRIPEEFSRQLLSMLGIAGAARKNALSQVAMLAARAAPKGKLAASWARLSAVVSPWDRVAATLNTGLFGIMPVIWKKESQLRPALLCLTAQRALFAHALFRVGGVGACRRCGNPFFASRDKQSYCSYRCRVAEAMKRYRKRQGRKLGRRTKR